MALPTGIFISFECEEAQLKKMLQHTFENTDFGKKLGYYFSSLLYNCVANSSTVFLFNFDAKTKQCYIAYVVNHIDKSVFQPFNTVLKIISSLKNTTSKEYAMVATTFPEVIESYQLCEGNVEKTTSEIPAIVVQNLMDKFWSFSENNSFPEPHKALNKRNYFYKKFKNYYSKYLVHIEEIEKPKKISEATKENPYLLFDSFYTYDNKVVEFKNYTNQIIEIPQADPLTFRDISGIKADKNFVFISKLAPNSPPETIREGSWTKNNPNAIWEWNIISGIDGGSLNYVKEKWDTVFWKDKNAVFVLKDKTLIKVEKANTQTFQYLDFCFGKDNNHIFYLEQPIPIDANNYKLDNNGFIYDASAVFYFQHKIPLDAKTFKVTQHIFPSNPFIKSFVLEDKNGAYLYTRDAKSETVNLIKK